MTLNEILEKYGYTQTSFSKAFNIPLRTVQDWSRAVRTPPTYVLEMAVKILEYEKNQ